MPRGTQTFCNTVPEFKEELVGCPYNISHQLRPDRLVRHLVICRKESLSSPTSPGYKRALGIKICPYNSAHHIHRADMEHHLTLCASALQFKQELVVPGKEHIKLTVVHHTTAAADSDEEDWDKEMKGLNLGTYNPMEKVVKENLPVNAHLMNKSERRDLRSMQRLGDWEGVGQVVNGGGGGLGNGIGHLPVGMSASIVKKKKNKKKTQSMKNDLRDM